MEIPSNFSKGANSGKYAFAVIRYKTSSDLLPN